MKWSKREKEMMDLFLVDNHLTAEEIAINLAVSTKTVYRTIKKINDIFEQEIIISEIGKGFSLDYDLYLSEINPSQIEDQLDQNTRRIEVIFRLLLSSPRPLDVDQLYQTFYLSNETIIKDIRKIKEFIQNYHLELQNKSNALTITGTEKNIRKALEGVIKAKKLFVDERFVMDGTSLDEQDIEFITSQLQLIEERIHESINYPYNINLFSHIYILLIRYKVGSYDGKFATASLAEDTLDQEEQQLITEKAEIYDISSQVVRNIESYLVKKLTSMEVYYLFQYLVSSSISGSNQYFEKRKDDVEKIIQFFIEKYEQKFGALKNIRAVKKELYKHMSSLLYRLKNEINVINELLPDIQREYGEVFTLFVSIKGELQKNYQLPEISIDEIGFITLYFAKYQEQTMKKRRVLIMCSSGIGTSELLKVKIQKSFPAICVVDAVSFNQFKKMSQAHQLTAIDLLITTIRLKDDTEIPSILINALFTNNDKKNIEKVLEELV